MLKSRFNLIIGESTIYNIIKNQNLRINVKINNYGDDETPQEIYTCDVEGNMDYLRASFSEFERNSIGYIDYVTFTNINSPILGSQYYIVEINQASYSYHKKFFYEYFKPLYLKNESEINKEDKSNKLEDTHKKDNRCNECHLPLITENNHPEFKLNHPSISDISMERLLEEYKNNKIKIEYTKSINTENHDLLHETMTTYGSPHTLAFDNDARFIHNYNLSITNQIYCKSCNKNIAYINGHKYPYNCKWWYQFLNEMQLKENMVLKENTIKIVEKDFKDSIEKYFNNFAQIRNYDNINNETKEKCTCYYCNDDPNINIEKYPILDDSILEEIIRLIKDKHLQIEKIKLNDVVYYKLTINEFYVNCVNIPFIGCINTEFDIIFHHSIYCNVCNKYIVVIKNKYYLYNKKWHNKLLKIYWENKMKEENDDPINTNEQTINDLYSCKLTIPNEVLDILINKTIKNQIDWIYVSMDQKELKYYPELNSLEILKTNFMLDKIYVVILQRIEFKETTNKNLLYLIDNNLSIMIINSCRYYYNIKYYNEINNILLRRQYLDEQDDYSNIFQSFLHSVHEFKDK